MFSLSLFFVSASLLAAFSTFSPVEAIPIKSDKVITFPLLRIGGDNATVHPPIHQQLAYHVGRHTAQLMGRETPSLESQEENTRAILEAIDERDEFGQRNELLAERLRILLGMVPVHSLEDEPLEDDPLDSDPADPGNEDDDEEVVSVRRSDIRALPAAKSQLPPTAKPIAPAAKPAGTTLGGGPILGAKTKGPQTALQKSSAKSGGASGGAKTVPVFIEKHDVAYFITVTLNKQKYRLLVDTGSSIVWASYDSAFQALPWRGKMQQHYLDETFVEGHFVEGDIQVAGFPLPGFEFGVETTLHRTRDSVIPISGVIGLGPQHPPSKKLGSVMIQNLPQDKRLVSYFLGTKDLNNGRITFGGTDESLITPGSKVLLPCTTQNGLWALRISKVFVNNISLFQGASLTGVVDTGSTFVLAPLNIAKAIHSGIDGSTYFEGNGHFYVPCTTKAVVDIQMGDYRFSILSEALAHEPIIPGYPEGYCVSGIQSTPTSRQLILGSVFLKNVYFWTDITQESAPQVGFANLKVQKTEVISAVVSPLSTTAIGA